MTRFLSVFSGIEAASVAWLPLGWECAGVAEIEPFPCAVLAHHYPDVPNLGSVLAADFIDRAKALGPIDVLVGGPACQDFSVAGLRAGLAGDRGKLTLRWVEIIRAIRPAFAVTENVPGWLSVNRGHAFGAFLAGLVGHDTALIPPASCGGRWTDAGMVAGPGGRAAWRILDAQHFRLAQRRRRVFVVFCPGNGADPASVLFERKGVCRNPETRREARKAVAPTISARTKGGGGLGTDSDCDGGLICSDLAPTPRAGGNETGGHRPYGTDVDTCDSLIAFPSRMSATQSATTENLSPALGAMNPTAVAFDMRGREGGAQFEGPHDTANIRASSGGSSRSYIADSAVRRLTPTECARLQGFQDDYLDITFRGKPAADGNKYRALGNSFAVPVVRWIGERIVAVAGAEAQPVRIPMMEAAE